MTACVKHTFDYGIKISFLFAEYSFSIFTNHKQKTHKKQSTNVYIAQLEILLLWFFDIFFSIFMFLDTDEGKPFVAIASINLMTKNRETERKIEKS
jgi:hypothetical protein